MRGSALPCVFAGSYSNRMVGLVLTWLLRGACSFRTATELAYAFLPFQYRTPNYFPLKVADWTEQCKADLRISSSGHVRNDHPELRYALGLTCKEAHRYSWLQIPRQSHASVSLSTRSGDDLRRGGEAGEA